MGKWGNGEDRKKRLWDAGYNPSAVQSIVNALVAGNAVTEAPEPPEFKITGTETLKIEVDITKYCALELTLTDGSDS